MPYADIEDKRRHEREYAKKRRLEKGDLLRAQERARALKVKEWLRAYKMERGCIDCGYAKHWAALDFDHMEGKTINLANAKSIAQAEKEIERHKCVVRCANCHRIKSYETKTWLKEIENEIQDEAV